MCLCVMVCNMLVSGVCLCCLCSHGECDGCDVSAKCVMLLFLFHEIDVFAFVTCCVKGVCGRFCCVCCFTAVCVCVWLFFVVLLGCVCGCFSAVLFVTSLFYRWRAVRRLAIRKMAGK